MLPTQLEYSNLPKLLSSYVAKGRPVSIAFLNWFLEHIYRLDQVTAEDAICDKSNDRGIDGMYVDDNQLEVHVFQSKTKQSGTIGDKDLREFSGSLNQMRSKEALKAFLAGNVDQEIKEKIASLGIPALLEKGYSVRGVFVTNVKIDANGLDVIKSDPSIVAYDGARIAQSYVDLNIEGGIDASYKLSIDGKPLEFTAAGLARVVVLFADGRELANLPGISDGSLFELNVRLPLGSTKVNKAIRDSIADISQHLKFPLFHNGITLLADTVNVSDEAVSISNFVVVNGAQSLKQFFNSKARISSDLKILTRIIEIGSNIELAKEISINSNNQNGIRPRDLRSNDSIQIRLQAEFEKLNFEGYTFDVKRGEEVTGNVISNEMAGKLLLAFDLEEPWSCHQTYRIFDEKYSDIFARPEVNAHRIIFLAKVMNRIENRLISIASLPFAFYGLSKYLILYAIKKLLCTEIEGKKLCQNPSRLFPNTGLDCALTVVDSLIDSIIIDLNHELQTGSFKYYKSELKSRQSVEKVTNELLRSFEKDKARGKVDSIKDQLAACGIK